ncbi:MAG: replication initiator [Solirubrobacteraceae bacterium]
MTTPVLDALTQGVVDRLTRPDYERFEAQLRSSGYCAQPVRLRGHVDVCDGHGRRRQVWTTDTEPDGVLRKACGNRREAVCGPCAERYRADAWHLITAGLRGGKGIPESVMQHPAVFATLTAPSFGVVHAHLLGPDGQPIRCHPRRDRPVCEHGTPLFCSRIHGSDDPCLGEPLCPDCFDYDGAVIWNNLLGELWRRTMIYLPRRLAGLVGITQKRLHEQVRVSYVKVAEYQRRGLVHLHPLIRLDRRMPAYRADEIRPPAKRFTVQLLEQALRAAVEEVSVTVPDELGAGTIGWGEQLDVEQLSNDDQERRGKAGYLAKYTTKSTEQAGGLLHRITREEVEHIPVSEHNRRYLKTGFTLDDRVTEAIAADPLPALPPPPPPTPPATFEDPNDLALRIVRAMSTDERVTIRMHLGAEHVGRIVRRTAEGFVLDTGAVVAVAGVCTITAAPLQPPKRDKRDRRLAACAHTFGHRGHCLTKSRHWSMRLKDLRQVRVDHVRDRLLTEGDEAQRALAELAQEQRIGRFEFVGVGHLTTADVFLAAQAAARAREHRQLAREALDDHHNGRREHRCEAPQDESMAV